MSFYDAIRIGASGAADFEVERSLRFNSADDAYLSRTPSSAGNRKTWTWSGWLKFCSTSTGNCVFSGGSSCFNDRTAIFFPSGIINTDLCGIGAYEISEGHFKDFNAWYHFVWAFDTTQATASNRSKIYVNGSEISVTRPRNWSQNTDYGINNNTLTTMGTFSNSINSYSFDGYMAEINFIDGQQLTPSSFGETNSDTGQWVPIDTSGLTFGSNGFRLQFKDNSSTTTLGKDTSGNGNDFTLHNFSVSAGVGNDSFTDTPTLNFPTLNALSPGSSTNGTLSNGNLEVTKADYIMHRANFIFGPGGIQSGKWYWEVTNVNSNSSYYANYTGITGDLTQDGGEVYLQGNKSILGSHNHKTYTATTVTDRSNEGTNKTMQFLLDVDNQQLIAKYDGSTIYTDTSIPDASTTNYVPFVMTTNSGTGGSTWSDSHFNFGQKDFVYSVPNGYNLINSANLAEPTILLPNKHFDTLLYTGNGGTQSITGLEFQPDWVWAKNRSGAQSNVLYDAVRGATKEILSNSTNSESTESTGLTSFDSNGFTAGSNGGINGTSGGGNYVAWNWNAGNTDGKTYTVTVVSDSGNKYRFDGFGTSAVTLDLAEGGTYIFNYPSAHPFRFSTTSDGTHGGGSEYTTGVTVLSSTSVQIVVAASAPQLHYFCTIHSGMGGAINTNSTLGSSNFDGSIQSTVKVNATAGFSIVKYTGTGSNATIGHGLGVAPKVVIVKRRSAAEDWMVGIGPILGSGEEGHYAKLNSSAAKATGNGPFNSTNPSSSVVTLGTDAATNGSSSTYISYCFSEVAGYSKFGLYTGNGSNDGPFVFTGFRPAFIIVKATGLTESWYLYDKKRNTFNAVDKYLRADNSYAEGTFVLGDLLSNGFKIRQTDSALNTNGQTYIYFAFAEAPFRNARAR